jgi:hypothetical protein
MCTPHRTTPDLTKTKRASGGVRKATHITPKNTYPRWRIFLHQGTSRWTAAFARGSTARWTAACVTYLTDHGLGVGRTVLGGGHPPSPSATPSAGPSRATTPIPQRACPSKGHDVGKCGLCGGIRGSTSRQQEQQQRPTRAPRTSRRSTAFARGSTLRWTTAFARGSPSLAGQGVHQYHADKACLPTPGRTRTTQAVIIYWQTR